MATLADLRQDAKDRGDYNNTGFITSFMWDTWLNQGAKELWGFILSLNPALLTTTQDFASVTTGQIALPLGWMRIRFLEKDPDLDGARFLPQVNAASKHSVDRLSYYLQGNAVVITPKSSSSGSYRLHYVPTCPVLTDDDAIDAVLEQWRHYISVRAIVAARKREEVSAAAFEQDLALIRQDIQREVARKGGGLSPGVVDVIGYDNTGRS